MSVVDFDEYAQDYREIINKVSRISGEEYEFFIQLRLGLMQSRISEKLNSSDNMTILDFGCGTGATETFLKKTFPEARIFAVDSSPESIRVAREKNIDGVEFIHSTTSELPFPDGFFDLVYSNGTFHHIESAQHHSLISELSRICRNGAHLFVFENNPKNPLMMRAMKKNPFDVGAEVVHPRWIKGVAATSGFVTREVCYYFFFPRFLRSLRFLEKWLGKVPFGAQYFLWAIKE